MIKLFLIMNALGKIRLCRYYDEISCKVIEP